MYKGWTFSTIGNGTRSSSSTGYLTPAAGRSNLDIVINAQATKLEVTGTVKGVPSFRRVLVAEKAGGKLGNMSLPTFINIYASRRPCFDRQS